MKSPSSRTGRLTSLLWILALALAAATAWQLIALFRQSRQLESLRSERSRLARETRQLQLETERNRTQLTAALQELQSLATAQAAPAATDSELAAWLGRVNRLKEWLRSAPEKAIPEMQFLTSNDWLAVTLDNRLESEAAIRSALSRLRQMAKGKPEVGGNIAQAITAYANAHEGALVEDPLVLAAYLKTPLSPEVLRRYEPFPEIPGKNDSKGVNFQGARFVGSGPAVLREKAPVDEDYDSQLLFMKQGGYAIYSVSKFGDSVNQATKAFRAANPGRAPSSADELIPYFTTPVDAQKLREYWALPNP